MSRVIGNVKWFDSKKGYGFVTILTPKLDLSDQDIFLHYTSIQSDDYKKVYPGEYIEFDITPSNDSRGPCCSNVTGVLGGKLLTENTKYRYKIFPKHNPDNLSEVNDELVNDEVEN